MKTKKVVRHLILLAILLVLYVLQTTPGAFSVFWVRPVLIVPFVICVAVLRGEGAGVSYAILAGLLWDIATGHLIGFSALILMLCCITAALLTIYLIRVIWFNIVLLTAATMIIYCVLDYIFYYLIWGYPDSGMLFLTHFLPMAAYTTAISPGIYFVMKKINRKIS